ncbi:MAG: permease, partial [Bacteriovoracaceae bacterium]|nr:permease [Bacteriovoracaceae bacterium]
TAVLAGLGQNIWNPFTLVDPSTAPVSGCCSAAQKNTLSPSSSSSSNGACCCCCHHKKESISKKLFGRLVDGMRYAFGPLIRDMAGWLTIGILAGAAIDYFFPADALANLNGLLGKLAVMALAIPLYICASSSTPVAASLILKGMSPGTALLFLLLGPATNISNLLVMRKYIGAKGIIINLLSIVGVGLITATLIDYFMGANILKTLPAMHEHGQGGWAVVCAIVLLILLGQKPLYWWWKKGHPCCH